MAAVAVDPCLWQLVCAQSSYNSYDCYGREVNSFLRYAIRPKRHNNQISDLIGYSTTYAMPTHKRFARSPSETSHVTRAVTHKASQAHSLKAWKRTKGLQSLYKW